MRFQCSSASRKFLKLPPFFPFSGDFLVSVLFSEPKIPQTKPNYRNHRGNQVSVLFSEPKIPQTRKAWIETVTYFAVSVLFSEPKIPQMLGINPELTGFHLFQCSSASRKFLKPVVSLAHKFRSVKFQCSSASRKFLKRIGSRFPRFPRVVSVLFSEPKIPQITQRPRENDDGCGFQCSSASRKFLNRDRRAAA